MNRTIFFLLLFICTSNKLSAQAGHPPSPAGIKKQSSTSITTEKKSKANSAAPVASDNGKTLPDQNTVNAAEREKASKAAEMIRVDYQNMPLAVQLKINDNKANRKYLLEGIAKSFTVEIKTCLTDADQKKTLSFLKKRPGFINSQLVSAGVVKIIVEPTIESTDLKESMSAEGIHFNFLNRSYLLKN